MKNLTNFFNRTAKTAQKTGGGNSHVYKYLAVLLMILTLGTGQMWGDQGVDYSCGFEDGIDGWTKSSMSSIGSETTNVRTGSKSVVCGCNNASGYARKSVSVHRQSTNYIHFIIWAKSSAATTAQIKSAGGSAVNVSVGTSDWTRMAAATSVTGSGTTNKNMDVLPKMTSGSFYLDDAIVYYSTSSTTDVTYPNSPTAGEITTSALNWTNRDDSGDGATGRQATLIWRRTSGSANDLTLNNQGVYAVPATGSTLDQSGHWTLVSATVAANATSYSGSFSAGDVYAIVHRDLAYNYSSPAYVTIPSGGGGDPEAPAFTSPASEPAAVTYCVGDVIDALTVAATGSPTPTFKWYSNSSKSTSGATELTTGASYTPSNAAASDLYYYCVASNTEGNAQSEYFHVIVKTNPAIAWATQPAGGEVGDDDAVATVTTTPAAQAVTWTSSRTAVATVTNGTIHYVAPGFTNISVGFTYSGSDYCEKSVSVNKDIIVPITTDANGTNDKYWYYTSAVPSGSPDNGLTYSSTKTGNGLYGTKLNSDGYAWFAKAAVQGTLRIGAYYSSSSSNAYVVDIYACSSSGTKGEKIGSLTTPHVGGVSSTLDIDDDVEGIYIVRNTSSEGVLYFVEFKETYIAPAITSPASTPDAAEYTVGDETTALSVTATGTPTPTYQWYSNTTASTSEATTLTNCTTATYNPSSAAAGTLYYYCVATNIAGSATSPFFQVTVNAPSLPTHSISYDTESLKGQSVTGYPTEYYEGIGVASFDPLADVEGFHFTGWYPASIATTATTDQTITAQWTPTYSVTYNLNGAASGTLPTETAKYESQVFTLAAQGDIEAPTNKKFLGWKDQDGNKYAAAADYTMPGKAVTLTAYWGLKVEDVIYSWEGGSEGAIEVGGTAAGSTTGLINQLSAGYYCLKIDGKADWSSNYVEITLSGTEKVKTGDKIKYWGFYNKESTASARPKMRDANGSKAAIFDDGTDLPNLYSGGDPAVRTFTVPADINTSAVQITRSQTGSNTWISKLQIIREEYVDEDDLLTVTFNSNGGSSVASQKLKSGQKAAEPEDPTWSLHRFNGWQLSGVAYDFSTAVTENITLVANWTQLYTITYAAGDGSGDAPAAVPNKAATETFTVAANTFTAPDGKEFDKWNDGTNDYKAGDTYTVGTANVTLTAQWRTPVPKYAVTYNLGGASGDAPTEVDQAAGDAFFLASKPSRDGYVFRGWECNIDDVLYAAGASYTMTAAATTFTAIWKRDAYTLFHWRANAGTTTTNATNGTTTGGTVTLRSTDTNTWGTESVTYNASVASNMKATSDNEMKAGKNAVYLELNLTSGTFQAEDTIYVTGYNPWGFSTSSSFTSLDVDSVVTGATGKGDVKTGYGIIKDGVDASTIYVRRGTGSGSGIAAIKIIRPVERIVMNTEIALYAVSINDAAISAANLSTLQSTHELDLSDAYVNAPTVKFIERTTVTYDEGAPKITDREISVTASENLAGKWEATTTINTIDYTVMMAIPVDPELETETTTLTLESKTNHSDSQTFTFSGMNLEHNVTISLASPVAGMTISPTSVAPDGEGAITDQEVTVSYISMADVAATDVVLTVYYSETKKKEITLTYSSTKGYAALADVTGDITWDFSKAGSSSDNQTDVILANMPGVTNNENFNSQTLRGTFNKLKGDGNSYQGSVLKFHTTVPGLLTIEFSGTNNNNRKLQVFNHAGVKEIEWAYNSASLHQTKNVVVPAGDIILKAFEGETANNVRIYNMTFSTNLVPEDAEESTLGGNERTVNPQYYGTICLPKAGVMTGAALFQISHMDYKEDGVTPYKVYYDEVANGTMEAGMPYIFLAEQSTIGVYYTGTTEVTAGNELNYNGLYGTLVDITEGMNGTGVYMLYNNMVMHSTNPASYLSANRAYIQISGIPGYNDPGYIAPVPMRRRISTGFNGKNTATGLDEIINDQLPMTHKVLIDGQLFIIRGGQMYNATGMVVK